MDVFDINNLKTSIVSKANRNPQQYRHCRFPKMFSQAPDADGTENIIILMTEYYEGQGPKTGLMRILMDASY